ncbi:MAG: RNA-binding S4 domain-containing protein [Burkholderiales bacterium]|jgi:ribosome-associated protein
MTDFQRLNFILRGNFIGLDALLKATGLAESGGRARHLIDEGLVRVDGLSEQRRTCKIRAGQTVQIHGACIFIQPPEPISS